MPTHIVSGRSVGLSDEKITHVLDETLPNGVYTALEAAIVEYARKSTRVEPIDDGLYGRLKEHLSDAGVIELCLVVGTANLVNRFHATFHTDVDAWTDGAIGAACPLPLPPRLHDD